MSKEKTLDGILASDPPHSPEEYRRAIEHEKTLIPDDFLIPKYNSKYITTENVPVIVGITFGGEMTERTDSHLPPGVIVEIVIESNEIPVLLTVQPINFLDMENELVPKKYQVRSNYSGYVLLIKTTDFIKWLKAIDEQRE